MQVVVVVEVEGEEDLVAVVGQEVVVVDGVVVVEVGVRTVLIEETIANHSSNSKLLQLTNKHGHKYNHHQRILQRVVSANPKSKTVPMKSMPQQLQASHKIFNQDASCHYRNY